jgi:hypothetical protein
MNKIQNSFLKGKYRANKRKQNELIVPLVTSIQNLTIVEKDPHDQLQFQKTCRFNIQGNSL